MLRDDKNIVTDLVCAGNKHKISTTISSKIVLFFPQHAKKQLTSFSGPVTKWVSKVLVKAKHVENK